MDIDQAMKVYNNQPENPTMGEKVDIETAKQAIYQEALELLEDENFHTAIQVLEELTGIDFK